MLDFGVNGINWGLAFGERQGREWDWALSEEKGIFATTITGVGVGERKWYLLSTRLKVETIHVQPEDGRAMDTYIDP